MKGKFTRNIIVSTLALALTAALSSAAGSPSSTPLGLPVPASDSRPAPQANASAQPSASASPTLDFDQRMQGLEDQLDSVFSNTFHNFGEWFAGSNLASSIDLREQKDRYVARVYVPDSGTSKVKVRVENNMLHVTAEAAQKKNGSSQNERYEQIISLPGPVESDKMQVNRKRNLVVITLPKAGHTIAAVSPSAPLTSSDQLDQAIVDRMARMLGQMDQIFRDAFPNDLTNGLNTLQLGSAVHVDNQKDKYVVHFYLPDKDLRNVDVKLKNGELRLTASETEHSQKHGMSSRQSGDYEQLITLPGPVKEKGMKVARENGTIVVTLPKA
ncbi:MAG: Hsp20/alpha crystallin family protein [Chthoniobacterales bacterium]